MVIKDDSALKLVSDNMRVCLTYSININDVYVDAIKFIAKVNHLLQEAPSHRPGNAFVMSWIPSFSSFISLIRT